MESQAGKPLCSIQLNSFMWAAVSSVVCRRRLVHLQHELYYYANNHGYWCIQLIFRSVASALLTPTKVCDPLGDNNVYYSLFSRDKVSFAYMLISLLYNFVLNLIWPPLQTHCFFFSNFTTHVCWKPKVYTYFWMSHHIPGSSTKKEGHLSHI